MRILYSDILPIKLKDGQGTFVDEFNEAIKESDRVAISVGYVSKSSLEELHAIAQAYALQRINLNIGMYYIEGIPESIYQTAKKINSEWMEKGIGEIRMVRPFKYHGKLYVFYKQGKAFRAFIGSHNLGAIKLEAGNRRQYEISAMTNESNEVEAIVDFVDDLWTNKCSANLSDISDLKIIREENKSINGIEEVSQIPPTSVQLYEKHKMGISFRLPIKVPAFAERHMDDNRHYTKSNINVCYARPRSNRKARDWYETQMTVGADIYRMQGYPKKNVPFFVVTDDGYWFKAHTTSDNNKQFSAVGNELLIGRWLKGRLAAAGLVTPVNNTLEDSDRNGMITKEILDAYGCNTLLFSKTDQKALDKDGAELDIWVLSFIATSQE